MSLSLSDIKHTKILATIGPATDDPKILEEIIKSGVNACRMNFSHGNEEERLAQIKNIRGISARLGRKIAILQDLQGPKIRLGQLKDDMKFDIKEGDEIGLTYEIEHDGGNNLPSQYDLSEKCGIGDTIFLFDGKIKLIVERIEGKTVWSRANNSGWVISRKSINLPDMRGSHKDILTEKDLADLEWGIDKDFDYIALSFVHHADDVRYLREILKSKGCDRPIITKVETKTAILPENLEEIVKASDGIMVARGDLATEAGPEVVPVAQRRMLQLCQKHCKFSIVATQMLGSMVDSPQPTRAEVSDIATAVIDGSDAVMLSEETAMGNYPIDAVKTMDSVIRFSQDNWPVNPLFEREGSDERRDAIAESAVKLAEQVEADAIVVETTTGKMARNIAVRRPNITIIAVAPTERVANQMGLLFATRAFVGAHGEGVDVAKKLFSDGFFGKSTAKVVIVRRDDGVDDQIANTIQLQVFGEE